MLGDHKLMIGSVIDQIQREVLINCTSSNPRGGGTLEISGWGCAAEILEPLTYTRASSAEFCYPILE